MLVLIRHAKSSWKYEGLDDFHRPLNERGQADIPLMARHILKHAPPPDCFLTSSATRAMETSGGLLREMKLNFPEPQALERLYMASSEEILDAIRQEARGETVYVCGHNPGIADFACRISGEGLERLPTLGVVIFEPNTEMQWEAINWASLRVRAVLNPRQCREEQG